MGSQGCLGAVHDKSMIAYNVYYVKLNKTIEQASKRVKGTTTCMQYDLTKGVISILKNIFYLVELKYILVSIKHA